MRARGPLLAVLAIALMSGADAVDVAPAPAAATGAVATPPTPKRGVHRKLDPGNGRGVAGRTPPPKSAHPAPIRGAASTRSSAADVAAPGMVRGGHRPLPIVLPSKGESTKLTPQRDGLDMLRSLEGPVAPVVVIGPYRSGKSFLLNQLLGVPCGEGFGVGHTRQTETKGVWVWGEPRTMKSSTPGEPDAAVVYVDTEGFEATGMSDAYDDRIFALSSIMASVLVYNLPETVKESDIAKLSFAVELAEEFFARAGGGGGAGGGAGGEGDGDDDDETTHSQLRTFLPHSLMWLIQRDFLEGGVREMVADALKPVNNPSGDKHVDELNRIRTSLTALAKNSTAFGLKQPHLQRTKLCDLKDTELDATYVKQRTKLSKLVLEHAKAKDGLGDLLDRGGNGGVGAGGGKYMTGPTLAALIERSVKALNEGDFPSAGNVVDSFNRDALERHLGTYAAALESVALPAREEALRSEHERAASAATAAFKKERFGRGRVTTASLKTRLQEMYDARVEKNAFASGRECEQSAGACEDGLVALQTMRLPSLHKFEHEASACKAIWDKKCIGPSREIYAARLERTANRERAAFMQSYNARLLNGLLVGSIAGIVIFRFLFKVGILELASWALFGMLEITPKLYITPGESMFDSRWWNLAAGAWEVAAYNPFVDMTILGPLLGGGLVALLVWVRVRACVLAVAPYCPCLGSCFRCCLRRLGRKGQRGADKRKVARHRDLDV